MGIHRDSVVFCCCLTAIALPGGAAPAADGSDPAVSADTATVPLERILDDAHRKRDEVEACFEELDRRVPEVQVHDLRALGRTQLLRAESARTQGEAGEAIRLARLALVAWQTVIDRHLQFASTMVNVDDAVIPLRDSYRTLPEFYRRHAAPREARPDAIERYLRSSDAPRPRWIYFDSDREYYEPMMFGQEDKMARHRHATARLKFTLPGPVERAWVQAGFTKGGGVGVNGTEDVTGWARHVRGGRKYPITSLREGPNDVELGFYQPDQHFGMGAILRGGAVLKDGRVIPIVTGHGPWVVRIPGSDSEPAPRCLDMDDETMPHVDWAQGLSPRVVTPHSPWARPLAGGPLRVFAVVPRPLGRELIELRQRLDCRLNTMTEAEWHGPLHPDSLADRLDDPFDVAVVGACRWSAFPAAARRRLLERVRHGAGLVYFLTRETIEEMVDTFGPGTQTPVGAKQILHGVPLGSLAVFRHAEGRYRDQGPIITALEHGRGRVVLVAYPVDDSPHVAEGWLYGRASEASGLTPNTMTVAETEPLDYDYYFSLVSRAVLWAAQRLNTVDWTNSPARGEYTVRCNDVDASQPFDVRLRLRSRRYGVMCDQVDSTDGHDRAVTARFALSHLPAGEYFADQWLFHDNRVVDWHTTIVRVQGESLLRTVEATPAARGKGQTVPIQVHLASDLPAGDSLRAELVDFDGRIVARREFQPHGNRASGELPLHEKTTNVMFARVSVIRDGKAIESLEDRFHVRRVWDGEFLWSVWNGLGGPASMIRNQLWRGHMKALGVNALMPTPTTAWDRRVSTRVFEYDVFNMPYPPGVYELVSLEPRRHEALIEAHVQAAEWFAPGGPITYSLGDDMCLKKVDGNSQAYRDAYLAFLRDEYRDLSELNATWGTEWGQWQQLVPLAADAENADKWRVDVIPTGHPPTNRLDRPAQWMDECEFQEKTYLESLQTVAAAVRAKDPQARFTAEGVFAFSAYGGINWPALCRAFFSSGSYPDQKAWMYSGPYFRGREGFSSTWFGQYGGRMPDWHRWFTWHLAFLDQGAVFWWNSTLGGKCRSLARFTGILEPDYRFLEYGYQVGQDIRFLRRGLGKLLAHATPVYDPVAIVASQPSGRVTPEQGTALGTHLTAQAAWSELLEDLGLTPHWVTPDELVGGRLDRLGIKVLVLPRVVCISTAQAAAVAQFARAGGTVLADLRPGVRDERGNVVHPGKLQGLFGVEWADSAAPPQHGAALGMPGIYADPGLHITRADAAPAGLVGDIAVWIERSVGNGRAILLNFSVANYSSGGRMPPVNAYRTGPAGQRAERLRRLTGKTLLKSGVAPAVSLTDADRALPGLKRRYAIGSGQLLCILRPGPASGEYGGPERITVNLPAARHIYDTGRGEYVGMHRSFQADISNLRGRVFALLPERVAGIRLRATPNPVVAGDLLHYEISVARQGNAGAMHAIHLTLRDPAGKRRPLRTANVLTRNGRCTGTIQIAFNDAPGTWRLTAVDALTGLADSHLPAVLPTPAP